MRVQLKGTIMPLLAVAAAFVVTAPAHAQTAAPAMPPGQPIIEQAALDLLKSMCDTLAAAQTFAVSVRDVRQVPTTAGQMLDLIGEYDVQVQRPDKLRMEGTMGSVDTLLLYDGAKLAILDKPKKLYVSENVSGDLESALGQMEQKHGIRFGLDDFLAKDPYALFSKGLTSAYVVGEVTLDGIRTEQLVFATADTEFQLWIDPSTKLPKLLSATYLDTAPRPTHLAVEFDDWKTGPASGTFTFVPPSGSAPIKFLPAQ